MLMLRIMGTLPPERAHTQRADHQLQVVFILMLKVMIHRQLVHILIHQGMALLPRALTEPGQRDYKASPPVNIRSHTQQEEGLQAGIIK